MVDKSKTKPQLISELKELRARIAALNASEFKHKLAEQALRESEERFRHLSEAAFEAIVIHKEGVIFQANEQYYKLFGYKPEELEGIDAIPLTATAESALFMKEQIALGNLGPYEVVGLRKDGTTFPMEIRIKFMEDRGNKVRMAAIRDLTEQRQVEEALRASNELFEKTFRSQLDALFILDENNPPKIRDCNPSATRVFGYSRKEMLGRTTGFLHVDEKRRQKFLKHLYAAIDEQGFFHLAEFEMKRNDGTVFPTEHTVMPLEDEQGKRIGWVSVVRDIGERKRAENVLKESEQRFRAVLEAVPDLMLVLDAEGRYREVFTANPDLLYAPLDQLLDKTIHDVLPPEDAQQIQEIIARVIAEGEPQKYDYVLKTGGIERWFAGRVTKFKFQNSDCVLWCARDVTERKRMEAALGESEERYRGIVETQTELICRFLLDGTLTFVNDAICRLLGERREKLIGKNFYPYIHPDDQQRTRKNLESLSMENPLGTNEERVIMPDGEIHWWQWINQAFFDEQGSIVEFQSVGRDITKRKKAEDALRKSEAELAAQSRHLEEVNAALKVLLKRREQDKEELGENVLSNVRQLVFPYLEKLKRSQLDTRQTTLVDILESNMNEIVSPFVTKLSSKFMNLTPTEIKVASLIRDGRTTKEIAALLRLSENTIVFHRHNIRSKLHLKNKKVNLRSYLKSLRK